MRSEDRTAIQSPEEVVDHDQKRVPSLDDVPTPPVGHDDGTTKGLEHASSMSTISPAEAHETPAQIASRIVTDDPMEEIQGKSPYSFHQTTLIHNPNIATSSPPVLSPSEHVHVDDAKDKHDLKEEQGM